MRPGKGARGTILTRLIKSSDGIPYPNEDPKHRSNVVLQKKAKINGKGVLFFQFDGRIDGDELYYASPHWLKVIEEGNINDLFGTGSQQEPQQEEQQQPNQKGNKKKKKPFKEAKTKWKHSLAKRLLYNDVYNGVVPQDAKDEDGKSTMHLEDIFQMHDEYKKYDRTKFSARLGAIRKEIKGLISRRDEDYEALKEYIANVPVSYCNWKGFIQWQGSESQELVLQDIESGIFQKKG